MGKFEVDPRSARIIRVGETHTGRQDGGDDVTVTVQSAVCAVMGALGEGFGHPRPAEAMLGQGGGSGARARQRPAGGFAFAFEGGHQHAGAEQGNSLAPQSCPGGDRTVLDGDGVAVGGDDARRDLARAGVFGLTGGPALGGVIGAGVPITAGQPVVAVAAQRHPIGACRPRPARVGDLSGLQSAAGPPRRAGGLPRRGAVLLSIGVAPGAIQGALANPRPFGRPRRSLLLGGVTGDLLDSQLLRMPAGKRGQRQVRHVRIHPRAPVGGDLGATRSRGRGLIAALMGEQMGVIGPAAGCFAIADPHQVDLVPHRGIGQEMAEVRPLARPLRQLHRQHHIAAWQSSEHHCQRTAVISPLPRTGTRRGSKVTRLGQNRRTR